MLAVHVEPPRLSFPGPSRACRVGPASDHRSAQSLNAGIAEGGNDRSPHGCTAPGVGGKGSRSLTKWQPSPQNRAI